MNRLGTSQVKKGIRMLGTAVWLMTAPVLTLAQTVSTTASDQSPTIQPGTDGHFYYGPGMMDGWSVGHYGHGMMVELLCGLLWLLAIIGIVGGIAFLMHRACACKHRRGCGSSVNDNGNPSLKLLDERYARSEIGRDEYLEKRNDLEKK